MDAITLIEEHAEDADVAEADRAYSDAVTAVMAAVPVHLHGAVLALESAATAWGVALAESAYWQGVMLGVRD